MSDSALPISVAAAAIGSLCGGQPTAEGNARLAADLAATPAPAPSRKPSPRLEHSWLAIARQVVAEKQFRYVDQLTNAACPRTRKTKIVLDMTTASMLCTVYDALNAKNKDHFEHLPLLMAAKVGWKCVK